MSRDVCIETCCPRRWPFPGSRWCRRATSSKSANRYRSWLCRIASDKRQPGRLSGCLDRSRRRDREIGGTRHAREVSVLIHVHGDASATVDCRSRRGSVEYKSVEPVGSSFVRKPFRGVPLLTIWSALAAVIGKVGRRSHACHVNVAARIDGDARRAVESGAVVRSRRDTWKRQARCRSN